MQQSLIPMENVKPQQMKPKDFSEKPTLKDLGRGVYEIGSFSDPLIKYEVDLNLGTCTCPHFQNRKVECKHILFILKGEKKQKQPDIAFSLVQSLLQKAVRQNRGDIAI